MAHLTDERGQIILVAAFALGVIFIALAVVVNAAIFTENLATRGEATSDGDALKYRHEMQESVGEAIGYVNRDAVSTTTDSELESWVTANITDISLQGGRQKARLGRAVTVNDVSELVFGTRFHNRSGTFESSTGADTWTVASSVSQTRAFVLNVSSVSSLASSPTGAFNLSVNDAPTPPFWNMTVYRSSPNNVTVVVNNTNGDVAACTETVSGHFEIDVTGGTIDGEPCPALTISDGNEMWFPSDVSSGYTIRFNHANQIEGGYQGVLIGSLGSFPITLTSGTTDAIYSLEVRYSYQTPSLRYATDIRVAPGEPES